MRPVADGVQFYPAAATLTWQAPWLRFPFDFTVSDGVTDDSLFISLNIEIDEQEVANIKGLLNLTAQPGASLSGKPVQYAPHSSALYRRIFVSYSRRDTAVIEKFYRMQQLVGDDVFVDIHSILPGSDWQQALREAIQSADIFMLFWSPHSATSTHVRDEWQYALTHRCQETGCVGYIRPVYWQDELYPVPPELQHLHFKQVSI